MLDHGALAEVWCETQDDITLIWSAGSAEEVEFVQVKGNLFDGVWNVPRLCQRDSRRVGTSIVESLISFDRAAEDARFRLITSRDVATDLQCLKHDLGVPIRSEPNLSRIAAQLETKLPGVRSPKAND